MNQSNDELLHRVVRDTPPESSKRQQIRTALARWFEGRRNYVLLYMTLWNLASALVIAVSLSVLIAGIARETRLAPVALAFLVLGASVNVLVKLWYWIMDNKISVMKELKLMQLSAQDEEGAASEDGFDEATLERVIPEGYFARRSALLESLSPQTMRWITRVLAGIAIAACIAASLAVSMGVTRWSWKPSSDDRTRVEQADTWRITGSGEIAATSRITYRANPGNQVFLTLALPYSEGKIRSVSADGAPLRFQQLDWRRYEVQLPVFACKSDAATDLVVEWNLPMDALLRVEDGFRTTAASMLPVEHYSLDAVLDPDSGFESIDDPAARTLHLVVIHGAHPMEFFGSCGIAIRRTAS